MYASFRYRDRGGDGNSLEFDGKGDKGGRNYLGGIRHRSYIIVVRRTAYVAEKGAQGEGEKNPEFRYVIVIDVKRVRSFFSSLFVFPVGKCLERTRGPKDTIISYLARGKRVEFFAVLSRRVWLFRYRILTRLEVCSNYTRRAFRSRWSRSRTYRRGVYTLITTTSRSIVFGSYRVDDFIFI